MACQISKLNAVRFRCKGVCCLCIKESIQTNAVPICLSIARRAGNFVLASIMFRRNPVKDISIAHGRRFKCPRKSENTGICPCTKLCPYILPSAMCCMCLERYRKKGSKPKCFRKGLCPEEAHLSRNNVKAEPPIIKSNGGNS